MSWAEAFRDTCITAMHKGQFIPFAIFTLLIVIVIKLDSEANERLVKDIINRLDEGELYAYILLAVLVSICFMSSRNTRRKFSGEYKRIGREKSALQKKVIGHKLDSSD